jgi:hypothetical protein
MTISSRRLTVMLITKSYKFGPLVASEKDYKRLKYWVQLPTVHQFKRSHMKHLISLVVFIQISRWTWVNPNLVTYVEGPAGTCTNSTPLLDTKGHFTSKSVELKSTIGLIGATTPMCSDWPKEKVLKALANDKTN